MSKDSVKTALSVIERCSKAIIGSVDADGYPNVKAMLKPREYDGVKTFYFTTNTSSMRVAQYRKNPKASIYFFDERFFKGVLLKGKMSVHTDAATKKRIWREGDEMYYPKGVSDPDYCVLKFSTESGRLYENFSSKDFDV
ncbi:MAG: pyridoxamine 5'-phosphate oxidase family protein [Candidatus Micrarchaeia archaeon]|jgi:general stress protein 26